MKATKGTLRATETILTLRIPKPLLTRLRRLAKSQDTTVSRMIREMVRAKLEEAVMLRTM